MIEIAELDNHDLVAMIIAGVCHDFAHDGYNNAYHVNANTMRSIRYTDSVQENYHAAESFQLLMKPDNNFLEALSREDVQSFKKRMIGTNLATDMAKHAEDLASFKRRIELTGVKMEEANGSKFLDRTNGKTIF